MSFIKNLKIGQKVVLVLVIAILVAFSIAGIVISRMALKFSDESAMVQVKVINGIVAGIISDQKAAAEASNGMAKLRERIVSIRVGKTGHPFIVNAASGPDFGKMFMHPDAKLEGVVVLDVPDAKGRKIFREMLEKKQGELEYRWAGDVSTSNNVLAYTVDPTTQLLIGTWANADEVGEGIRSVITVAMAIGLVLLVVLPLVIVLTVRRIVTRPLSDLQRFCTEIERSHDFTVRPPLHGNDEVGQTTAAVERLTGRLRTTFSQLLNNIARVDEATRALADTARNSAQNSSQASDAATAMAASVEQLTVGISHISDNASEAASLSRDSGTRSQEGGKTILAATQEMNAIAAKVRSTSEAILALGQESRQISGIVSVIKEVAEQTNLLALNAAIEAARAGEAGRGFAVVADEVRKLAERTTHATSEIANVTGSIQQRAEQAVNVMSDAVQQVEQGAELANRAGTAIEDIRNGAERVVEVVTQITDALAESSTASHGMSVQTERVARVAEDSDHAAQSAVQASANLEQLMRQMREVVQVFRI